MMKVGLFQQQTLKLTMTKELSQAIEILQYSTLDLISFLQEQTLENPLIEIKVAAQKDKQIKINKKKPSKADTYNWIENIGGCAETLQDHLRNQAALQFQVPLENKLVNYLIEQVDENGYLTIDEQETANYFAIPLEKVEQAIYRIQSLDPAGVGARSLKECILLQIQRLPERSPLAETIISDYFELFANKTWKTLTKLLNVDMLEIQNVLDFIQIVKPKPGAIFQTESAKYIIPDMIIKKVHEDFEIIINDEHFPSLSMNTSYHRQLVNQKDATLKSYANEKFQQWQWIVKSLEQRKNTLITVMNEILKVQVDFFAKGPLYLKPLTMRKVADVIGVHESTVSRAVRDKYVQTPFGTFEMRHFFTSSIQMASNEDTSSEIVKQHIEELVKKENKQKPLSDQKLVEILEQQKNIIVSRRTIAKYRDQLGITSSSKRKRYS
jgi:RNA polymerase sigma-54 factor